MHYLMSPEAGQRIKICAFWSVLLLFPTSLTFIFFPQIDLHTSSLFVGSDNLFYLRSDPALAIFFKLVDWIARLVLAFLLIAAIYTWIKRQSRFIPIVFVLISLLFGPTVLVNNVFKEHWDRARPREIMEFGGTKIFTPAWVLSDQCQTNCSFTSGHAAAGFAPFVLFFIFRRYSRLVLFFGVLFGMGIGYTRIIVGAHFLSDIVFSGFLVLLSALLLAFLFWFYRIPLNKYFMRRFEL
jgi:lipid A 4'-phosphatase